MMKSLRFIIFMLIVSGAFWGTSGLVSAAALDCKNPQSLQQSLACLGGTGPAGANSGLYQGTSAGGLLKSIILWLLSLVAVLALLAFIVGGIMYIISFGDEGRAEKAKNIILYAVIGLLVVGASFLIIQVIATFLKGGTPGAATTFLPTAWAQEINYEKGFQGGIDFIKKNLAGESNSGIKDFGDDFAGFVIAGLKIVLGLVGIIAVAVLMWGGVKYVISLGDEDAAADAKRLILYAIIGLIIIGASLLIVNVIIDFLNKPPT